MGAEEFMGKLVQPLKNPSGTIVRCKEKS